MLAEMRIVSYQSPTGVRAGLTRDQGVVDIWSSLDPDEAIPTVRRLLESGRFEDAGGVDGDPVVDPKLAAPVPDPQKIICVGLNYHAHAAETGRPAPESPAIFGKYANALAGNGATIDLPLASEMVDYEAEVAFVIGKTASHVPLYDALDHIAGFMLLNDLSARDLQFATPQWMAGKIFDQSAPCGPALVTLDEAGDVDAIEIEMRLNGETMQQGSTSDLIFSIPELVSHISTLTTLRPGDIVSTGTPSGVGAARSPQVFVKPGDEMVIESPTLGRLVTHVA